MRIVFPLAGLNVSGGVKNLLVQAGALAAAGHQVRVVVPDFADRSIVRLPDGVTVSSLSTGPSWWPAPFRKAVYYLRLALACTAGADLAVTAYFLTVYAALVSSLLRKRSTRILYSVAAYEPFTHGLAANASGPSRRLRAGLAALSYRLPVQRVYASNWLREAVGDRTGQVIGRGIDTRVFSPDGRVPPSPGAPLRIGVIGRRGAVKGYADVLTALDRVRVPGAVVARIVALDPVPLPASMSVETYPPQDESGMAAFYRACDIFVFASLSEGFPSPPLEAMACGCAVVATACGGIAEYARDGENCLLVPPGDPVALAAAIERLSADRALRDRLARAGVRTGRGFDRAAMVERFLRIAVA